MSVLAVTLDLKEPGANYEALHTTLKAYKGCRALKTTWLLDTRKTPGEIAQELFGLLGERDQVFVVRLHQDWMANFADGATGWLRSPARRWD